MKKILYLVLLSLTIFYCKKENKNNDSGYALLFLLSPANSSYTGSSTGSVAFQNVTLTKGTPFTATYKATIVSASASILGSVRSSGVKAVTTNSDNNKLEVSVQESDGSERSYNRNADGTITVTYTPNRDGVHRVSFRNNSSDTIKIETSSTASSSSSTGTSTGTSATSTGASTSTTIADSNSSTDAKFKGYTLKAFVAFSQNCYYLNTTTGSNVTTTATGNDYFIQPIVFLGKVGTDSKVTDVSTATVTIVSGSKTITLKKLSDLDIKSFGPNIIDRTNSDADTIKNFKSFYQGYLGGAGEMYTIENFSAGSVTTSCGDAYKITLNTDVGATDIKLNIVESTLGMKESFKIRPTISANLGLSTYTSTNTKLTTWTMCQFDRITGSPTPFNIDPVDPTCKTFSLKDPPYIQFSYGYLMSTKTGYTVDSDPTRVIYYGSSRTKSFYTELIKNADTIISGTDGSQTLTLSGCLNSGGLVGVPFSTDVTKKSFLPLKEFNPVAGDVVDLGWKLGSYTSLNSFYQGNVDVSGSINISTCIPKNGSSCNYWKNITVKSTTCKIKADSGITVTSIDSGFVYPTSFNFSGIIAD
jgi:hypothetical protein